MQQKKAVLFTLGTRGDVEPFLAVAEILSERSFEVVCVFPEQFRSEVETIGYKFYGFDAAFLELLRDQDGQKILGGGGSPISRLRSWIALARKGMRLNRESDALQQEVLSAESPELVIRHPKCLFTVIWGMANPGRSVLLSPIPGAAHPVDDFGPVFTDHGKRLNRIEHGIVNTIKAVAIRSSAKKFKAEYPGIDLSLSAIRNAMVRDGRAVYTISPSLFRKPNDWPGSAYVVGYFERDKTADWSPPADLEEFLQQHEKPIFISFGSMTNPQPAEKTRIILNVLEKLSIPAVINTSWGGLQRINGAPPNVHFVESVPYDWLFPRVYAAVHHGGSGTTHTALKFGCPSLLVPHAVDQFMWAKVVENKGLGPKAIPVRKLYEADLTERLGELYNIPVFKANAVKIGQKIASEADPHALYRILVGDERA